jgi:hypothetical protein
MGWSTRARRRAGTNRRVLVVLSIAVALGAGAATLAGCGLFDGGEGGSGAPDTTGDTTTSVAASDPGSTTGSTVGTGPTTSPAPASNPPPVTTRGGTPPSGPPGPGCVEGWTTPAPGTPERQAPLDVIREAMEITGEFEVSEMRHFFGPDVIPDHRRIEHWYVEAALADDPSFRGRWIVTQRNAGGGAVSAAAPYGTAGYRSPDWRAFGGIDGLPGETPRRYTVPGLPGLWWGEEYDFVTGGGSDRGLPGENEGCLDGT